MKVVFINFPSIIDDNEANYYSTLQALVESLDHEGIIRITKKIQAINVRISPSHPQYLRELIEEMKQFHTLYGLRLEFSKSMKKTCNINFDISI